MHRLALCLLFVAVSPAHASQPIEAVLSAMEIDVSDPGVLGYRSDLPDGTPTTPTMYDVLGQLGTWTPIGGPTPVGDPLPGNTMALMSTGDVGNITQLVDYDYPGGPGDSSAGDTANLFVELVPPMGMNSLAAYFNFCSREYPEWVGNIYNDFFTIDVDGPAWTGQAAFDSNGSTISVNSVLFDVIAPAALQGTGFDQDGCTGWLRIWIPVTSGQPVSVRFSVGDVSDGVWDSAVLLDDFDWSNAMPTSPFIQDGIDPDTGLTFDGVDYPGMPEEDPEDPEDPVDPEDPPEPVPTTPNGQAGEFGRASAEAVTDPAPAGDDGPEVLVLDGACSLGGGASTLLLLLPLVARRRA